MSGKIFGVSVGTLMIIVGTAIIVRLYGARIPVLNSL